MAPVWLLLAALSLPGLLAHPVFGTARYGRSPSWGMQVATPSYYPAYPYGDASDYYFYQPVYGYYGYDGLQQEEEREEREEALPIGQETWFESTGQQDMADVNAVFLHNLILSQMYADALNRHNFPQPEEEAPDEGWIYGDVRAQSNPEGYYSYDDDDDDDDDSEDEDVRELKSLVKKAESPELSQYLTFTDRKGNKAAATTTTTTPAPTTTSTTTPAPEFDARRGMKEVALLRPAGPARRPLGLASRSSQPRPASVYDMIKKLMLMEEASKLGRPESTIQHTRPRKRFVSSEESLVQELSGLKKTSA